MAIPKLGSLLSKTEAMDLAIQLAYLGSNRVSPNPHVGCVVVDKSYKLLSYGYHEYFGGPHAEVNALKDIAVSNLEGAHVFVSLEPCSIYRKTPACADFLLTLPIESLTYGIKDPNPDVSGRGLELLEKNNIRTHQFTYKSEEIEDLLLTFKHHLLHKETFVSLKVASSLDGAITDNKQKSQWITSKEAREQVHFLRSRFQAILVGKNTIIEDDPSLNVRHELFPEHHNKVLILNAKLELLSQIKNKNVYKLRNPEDIIFVGASTSTQGLELVKDNIFRDPKTGVTVLALESKSTGLDLKQLKKILPKLGIYDLMVEGGAVTYSSFLEQEAFDHIYLFQAPIVLGTKDSKLWTSYLSRDLESKIDLNIISTKKIGTDVLFQLSRK